ncbi:MAG: HAMP domain-containing sensor histidine kinase [Campylobacterales bacterium]|nr:HAMP domain-containing sensor histidine kinase [Campylobacterales bacterium]
MKNISLFLKIIFGITFVIMIFMAIFGFENYDTVNKQLDLLENEKFTSIAKTVEPIISINYSLGLESGYVNAIKQLFDTHPEIINVTLSDKSMHPFYEAKQNSGNKQLQEDSYILKVEMYDRLLNTSSGFITLHYSHSKYLYTIMKKYNSFLIRMFFLFIGSFIILTLWIYFSMDTLKNLTKLLSSYIPGVKIELVPMEGKNEVAVINNTVLEMLKKIDEYTHTLEDKVTQRTKALNDSNKTLVSTQNNLQLLNLNLEKQVERELEKRMKSEKELSHKSRLESMGEMIDNIAHQWRQPLMNINAIFMNIDRAYELGKLNKYNLENNIREATTLTAHMSQTIEDFRSFFRKDKEMEIIDINDIVAYSFSLVSSISKDITICFDRVDTLNISIYKNELIQVIMSVISNAVDVLKQRDIKDKKIFVSIQEYLNEIEITIEDNGGGITDEHIDRIFEPYYSTKHQYGGSGLGLYICKMIIEEHMDGSIKIYNTHQGAQFIITLKKGLV